MSVQAEKLGLIELLLKTNDEDLLRSVRIILESHTGKDFWDELSDHEKEAVEKGISEAAEGQVVEYEKLISKHRRK